MSKKRWGANGARVGTLLGVSVAMAACSFQDVPKLAQRAVPNMPDILKEKPLPAHPMGMGIETLANQQRFEGIVIADEPQAAMLARGTLEAGGNAADVATTLYFGLSVSYPGAAGLGGGGICLYRDAESGATETIEFLTAVPGNIRGFGYMHEKYGKLDWADTVRPAADMAATGFKVSVALNRQLHIARGKFSDNQLIADRYEDKFGNILHVGAPISSPEMAATLGLIAGKGPSAFYNGPIGAEFVAEIGPEKGGPSMEDLRAYKVEARGASAINHGGRYVLLPAAAGGNADKMQEAWTAALNGQKIETSYDYLDAEADGAGSTGFIVVDRRGNVASCGVTLNAPFGETKIALRSGIVTAKANGIHGHLGPVLARPLSR